MGTSNIGKKSAEVQRVSILQGLSVLLSGSMVPPPPLISAWRSPLASRSSASPSKRVNWVSGSSPAT
ncbi:hypothetical protein G6F22_015086 [Rhizopus arrhizus]|nr:hypothetical protein G6F22_015086 [Rhizopus arrhizus]